jgi:patatin-like phospholipase/acyl hydrolase
LETYVAQAPSYFPEYEEKLTGEKHQDGAFVANNPTAIAVRK